MPYNPFTVPPGQALATSDLQLLVDTSVAEGFFVEYKSMPPTNEKIGRSIASFANAYGGWYIVGVTTDEHNIANAIPGFDPALCPDPIARIRDVITTHISPSPLFFAQVVTLGNSNIVLVVYVPDGQDTPFISRDGRIYRRRHDSSAPIPETERYAVDKLIEQGKQSQEEFISFCRDERIFSNAEDKRRWVGIYIQPYPLGVVDRRHKMRSIDGLEEAIALSRTSRTVRLLDAAQSERQQSTSSESSDSAEQGSRPTNHANSLTLTGNIPFTSGMLSTRSIILRQSTPSMIGINSRITAELMFDGSAKFYFELHDVNPLSHDGSTSGVERDSVREVLLQHLQDDSAGYGITLVRFVDIAQIWAIVALLVTYYQTWVDDEPVLKDVKVAISLSGVWRTAPFLDADEWAAYVKEYGLPVLHQTDVWVPPNIRKSGTLPYDDHLWISICGLLQLALGLPYELLIHAILKVMEGSQEQPGVTRG